MTTSDLALLKERFETLTERESSDHVAVNCASSQLIELCTALRDDFGYDMLVDVTAVDWDAQSPRFTGIYHFLSTASTSIYVWQWIAPMILIRRCRRSRVCMLRQTGTNVKHTI